MILPIHSMTLLCRFFSLYTHVKDNDDMIKSNLPVKGTTSVQRRFCCPKARDKISNWLKAASKHRPSLQDCTGAKNQAAKGLGEETQLCEYLKMVDPLIPSNV